MKKKLKLVKHDICIYIVIYVYKESSVSNNQNKNIFLISTSTTKLLGIFLHRGTHFYFPVTYVLIICRDTLYISAPYFNLKTIKLQIITSPYTKTKFSENSSKKGGHLLISQK